MAAGDRAYLDYNATAPLRPAARDAMIDALAERGNPSSVHQEGRSARAMVEHARRAVAASVSAPVEGTVFTSGGTEANAWMLGSWDGPVAVSAVEHDAVRLARHDALVLPVDQDGIVSISTVDDLPEGTLVSIMAANNETGVLQPIADLAERVHVKGLFLHCDAVQTCGRLATGPLAQGADAVTISAHKLGGPKGVGALAVADPHRLPPALIRGGGQEHRRRAGTENVAAIAGFAAAVRDADEQIGDWCDIESLRDWMEERIETISPSVTIAGKAVARLPNTICVAMPGTDAQATVIAFDLAGISVSSGAACSSGKVARSHVLEAMGWEDNLAGAAVRVSLGLETTRAEAERFVAAWQDIIGRGLASRGLAA